MKIRHSASLAALAAVVLSPMASLAQATAAPQAAPPAVVPAGPAAQRATVRIPEGAEIDVSFNEKLSSATSTDGDKFSVTSEDPIKLADGTIIPAGYRGVGEVTHAQKRGMMGKGGELNVRLDYLRIGETKVRLRASQGKTGEDSMGATVALTLLFGPLGLLKHGHDIDIPAGQKLTAYVDADADVVMPLAIPPARE